MMSDISKWNNIAFEYSDWLENQKGKKGHIFNVSLIEAILKRLPTNQTFNLIDLGCGDGSLLSLLGNRYKKVKGIDGSENMIEIAVKKNPHLKECFSVHDITKPLPIEDNTFNVAICNMVLMDLEDIKTTITEIYRILKNGGVFILNINHPCFSFLRHQSTLNKRYIDNFCYKKSLDTAFSYACNNYHRPIQFYVEHLLQAGFIIKGFEEISIKATGRKALKQYELTANALLLETHKKE